MQLQEFINQLKKSDAKKLAKKVLVKEEKVILNLLKAHSPVDTDKNRNSMVFRENWIVKNARFTSGNVLAGIEILNTTPNYGQFIIAGAPIEKAPWYYPKRDKRGRFVKGTGKLKKSKGRVWAGGLSPGHSKTVGGPIVNVLSKYVDKFAQEFGDEFVRGFV